MEEVHVYTESEDGASSFASEDLRAPRVSKAERKLRVTASYLVQQREHLDDIQLYIFQIQQVLVVFLLHSRTSKSAYTHRKQSNQPTFSNRSSIFKSISNIALSRPL